MIDWLKTLLGGVLTVLSWILVIMLIGFVARINFEIFMIGWGFIK